MEKKIIWSTLKINFYRSVPFYKKKASKNMFVFKPGILVGQLDAELC